MERTRTIRERLIAWVMALAMVFGMIPSRVFAADTPVINVSSSKTYSMDDAATPVYLGAYLTNDEGGTWSYVSDDTSVVTVTSSSGNVTLVGAGTTLITVDFTSSTGVKAERKTVSVEVTAATPVLNVTPSSVTLTPSSGFVNLTATVTNPIANGTITWHIEDDYKSKLKINKTTGNEVSIYAEASNSFTTDIIVSYDGAVSQVITVTFEGTDPVSGDYYLPNVTWNEEGDIVNKTTTSSASRLPNIGAVISTEAAGGIWFESLDAAVTEFQSQAEFVLYGDMQSITNISVASGNTYGRTFSYEEVGQTQARFWIDFNNNGSFDSDTEGLSGSYKEFTITNTGIKLSQSTLDMGTYTSSTEIYVYSYGDVGSLSASSQNPALVSITTELSTAAPLAMTIVVSSKGETGSTLIMVEPSSGGSVSLAVKVSDNVGDIIYPDLTANESNPLWFKDIIAQMHDVAGEIYSNEALVRIQSLELESTSMGVLHYGYKNSEYTGGAVGTSLSYYISGSPNISDIVYVPLSTFSGTAVIKYTGYTTSERSFYGEIHVTVGENPNAGVTTSPQDPVDLSSTIFATIAETSMGQSIDYLVFNLPDPNDAVMYYDYTDASNYHHKITQGEQLSLSDLNNVTVITAPGFGTPAQDPINNVSYLEIPYIAVGVNGTVIYEVLVITVTPYEDYGPIFYNTRMGEYLNFVTEDFHVNSRNNSKHDLSTGYDMASVTFTLPDPTMGTLYWNYISPTEYQSKVTSETVYYATARDPQISQVSFVPASGFTGSVNIPFVGTNTTGASYAGTVQINVTSEQSQDINYICTSGSSVFFYEEDFNQFSRDWVGNNVNYITFTNLENINTMSQGTLKLNPTNSVAVVEGQPYYRTASPYMSAIYFESVAGYTGTVEINFEGMSTTGQAFAGTISIVVTNQNVVSIPYSGTRYEPVELGDRGVQNFQHYAYERTSSDLDYVRFVLPDSAEGTLYYDFTSVDEYESLVTGDLDYYAEKSNYLSKVTFVPNDNFSGVCNVNFTAWGTNGQSYVGRLVITVADSGDPLHYQIHGGETVSFGTYGLNAFCKDSTNSDLSYITLNGLPTVSQGTLYESFNEYSASNSAADTSTRYYYNNSNYSEITDLVFQSTTYFIGTVTIPFTATAVSGATCSGNITIVVLPQEADGYVIYNTTFSPVIFNTADISDQWDGATIDYITLHNLPGNSTGTLYYENNLNSFATLDTPYYGYNPDRGTSIDTLIFVPKAAYTGTVTLAYTAVTLAGSEFIGEIQIVVSPLMQSAYFSDMYNHTWAISSADYLYSTGVTSGVASGSYGPSNLISRGDYALMIQKAFRFGDIAGEPFSDVPTSSYYSNAITTLRYMGVLSGSDNMYNPTESISRQDAMIMMHKAMVAANKSLPSADLLVLYGFRDVTSIYTYAADSLSIMVQAGIVDGDSSGYLNPQNLMTRAEMAIVMHKAMTY